VGIVDQYGDLAGGSLGLAVGQSHEGPHTEAGEDLQSVIHHAQGHLLGGKDGGAGEPFTEIGRSIYRNSPFERMMICALTGASCGYVGTSKAYDEGGYETLTSSYKKGADLVMIDGMLELLNQI
jgi:hypothetical protein